jgi:N-acetylneuraminic acid mutarotase
MQKKSTACFFNRHLLITLFFLAATCSILCATLLGSSQSRPANSSERMLTFEDRVAYQRLIEEIYWRHRTWPQEHVSSKPSLDTVMTQGQLERKVADYLRKSQALEECWQQPLTAEQLQAEMDRMAGHTKRPEVLRELFQVLENDPFVIAECLARPVVTEHLMADLSARDKIPRVASAAFDGLRRTSMPISGNEVYTLPKISEADSPCTDDTWMATATTNAPTARQLHTAVWTGSEMIIWGGNDGNDVNSGGKYDPITDSWTTTNSSNAPDPREGHTAVWTGSEMIIWGGVAVGGPTYLNSGGRYNPATDTWTATSAINAPDPREDHTAVWTGSEMIVWGGASGNGHFNTGGRYNPITDSWTPTSTSNAPGRRFIHTAVWTGHEMIVWGGLSGLSNTGGKYNPNTDSWTATSTNNAPTGRANHTAVWTGSEMIVWGGRDGSGPVNTGGRYNPSTDSWRATSITNAASDREVHTAVWTGSKMVVWGGFDVNEAVVTYLNTGGRYDPGSDSWTMTTTTNAPDPRAGHTAVWTGSEMIAWSGSGGTFSNTGGEYCAESGASTPTPTPITTGPPIVATNPATNVANFSATLNGTVNPRGFITAAHFEYGTTTNYGSSTAVQSYSGNTVNNVIANLSSLRAGAMYHFRIVGSNAAGTTYGNDRSFTTPAARAVVADFNGDGTPDLVVERTSTHQSVVLYLNNNVVIGAAIGLTLPAGWSLAAAADFDGDGHTDYVLFNSATGQTFIVYLSGVTVVGVAAGPSISSGWELVATADFDGDGHPDYVLNKASTHETAIWYLNNNVFISATPGPTLPSGWNVAAVADFNGDGHPDYALFNSITGQTVIGYLSGGTIIGAAFGPTVPGTWPLVATADFSQDGHPDYLLFNPASRQTAIGYLNNNVLVNAALGPTFPSGWSVVGH